MRPGFHGVWGWVVGRVVPAGMARMRSLGQELAASADLIVAITQAGSVRSWRGVKCSTVMPQADIRA
jgi:hypothetical protein